MCRGAPVERYAPSLRVTLPVTRRLRVTKPGHPAERVNPRDLPIGVDAGPLQRPVASLESRIETIMPAATAVRPTPIEGAFAIAVDPSRRCGLDPAHPPFSEPVVGTQLEPERLELTCVPHRDRRLRWSTRALTR